MKNLHLTFWPGALLLAVLTFSSTASAQHWAEAYHATGDPDQAQAAFEAHLTDWQIETGKGIKPFERWKWFWGPRTWESQNGGNADLWKTYQATLGKGGSYTKDAGNWTELGMWGWDQALASNPGNGRVNWVTVDPNNPSRIFACTPSGGLWKSNNSGQDWETLTDQLPTLGVSGLAIHPSDEDIMYMATGDGDGSSMYGMGVLKSTDGGATWNTTGMVWDIEEDIHSNGIMMHPEDPETLFVFTSDGLFKTVNGGLTWYLVQGGDVNDVEFHPNDPNIVYCCTDRFFKSTDGGEDFDPINSGLPPSSSVWRMELAVTPDNPEVIFAVTSNSSDYGLEGVYRSLDSGESWTLRTESPNLLGWSMDGDDFGGQGWYDLDICVNPENSAHVFVGGVNLWESTNAGLSWNINAHWVLGNANYVHADIHFLRFFGDEFWCGSDGGVFQSTNDGDSWQNRSEGLGISQFYRFGVSPQDATFLLCGAQDNGTNLLSNGTWDHVMGADGMEAIVHPTDPDILFAASQYGGIQRSTNGGLEFEWATQGIDEDGAWVTPYIMNPVNPNVLYSGFQNVWRSTDLAQSWVPISDFPGGTLRNLGMSPVNPNVLYASTNSKVYRTADGGTNWEDISSGLPSLSITYITVDSGDENHVWVTFSGFTDGVKLFETTDGGATWNNISMNLPNIPANCVAHDPATQGVYVGTEFGVFYNDPSLAGWESFNSGLPNTIVNELVVHEEDQKLIAATYGRGMWMSDLWQPLTTPPTTQASYGPVFLCEGDSAFFQDQSSGNAPGWTWTFDGGTPGDLDTQEGWVTFADAGVYSFTLTTSNANGDDTFACDGCIHVFDSVGVSLPLFEGFENDDLQFTAGDWFVNADAAGNGWSVTNQSAFGGTHAAWINNYTIDTEEIYTLSSRPFDLSESPNYTVSFRVAHAPITEDTNDRLRLYTSTDCGLTWSLRQQYTTSSGDLSSVAATTDPFAPQNNDEWNYFEFELPESDLTSHTSFQFWFLSDNGNNIYLDDINLGITNVSEAQLEDGLLRAYPNPGSDDVTLEFPARPGQWVTVRVLDASGRNVLEERFTAIAFDERRKVNAAQLTSGSYILEVATAGFTGRVKWIRQ